MAIGNWSGGKEDSMDRSTIAAPRYCASCLKAGCTSCYAVEGGVDCAFCEDGEPCPSRKRMQERAQAERRATEAARAKSEAAAIERREHPLACQHCEFVGQKASGLSVHLAKKHGIKFEKKEKEKVMDEQRFCSREGCGVVLKPNNKSGRCTKHFYVPKKKSGGASSAPASTERPVTPRKAKAAKNDGPKIPKAFARAAAAAAVCATIQVTEAALDSWWTKLDVQGKADAFTNAMVLG